MLIIVVRKWERRMVNDDGDVVRVQGREVVRGGLERDEGNGHHGQLAVWVIGKCFAGVNGFYGMYYMRRVDLIYDGNLFVS